jgi:hypothetical protein
MVRRLYLWSLLLSSIDTNNYSNFEALPFLIRSELLLFPLVPLLLTYVVSLLGFNMSKTVLIMYFGQ